MNTFQERYFARLGESGSEELYDDGADLAACCRSGGVLHTDGVYCGHGAVGADGYWTNTVADNYKGPFRGVPNETLMAFHLSQHDAPNLKVRTHRDWYEF